MTNTKLVSMQGSASLLISDAYQAGYTAGFEAAKEKLLTHLGATPKRRGRPPKAK